MDVAMSASGDHGMSQSPPPGQQQQPGQGPPSNSAGGLSFRRYSPTKAPIVTTIAPLRQTLADFRPTRQRASRACETCHARKVRTYLHPFAVDTPAISIYTFRETDTSTVEIGTILTAGRSWMLHV
ncbi:hypothetical protein BR93DRAFT_334096 [Coniochaeta sp. PMI_546]|nr:hypothetical protein BR93DRAFT_334096 [Coniochaeta sp. PMI_546]